MKGDWRPVKTVPKDWVLAASSNGVTVEIVRKEADGSWWDGKGYYWPSCFTHWMPLPEPPK